MLKYRPITLWKCPKIACFQDYTETILGESGRTCPLDPLASMQLPSITLVSRPKRKTSRILSTSRLAILELDGGHLRI